MGKLNAFFAPSLGRIRGMLGFEQSYPPVSPKECVRTMLHGGMMLSIPIVGGNSLLKSRNLIYEDIKISRHGDWEHKHLGAWQAVYGKTPFFQHIFPLLQTVYSEYSNGLLLDFNHALYGIVEDFLELDMIRDSVVFMHQENTDRLRELQEEALSRCDMSLTVFDSLFRLGKDAVYLFI